MNKLIGSLQQIQRSTAKTFSADILMLLPRSFRNLYRFASSSSLFTKVPKTVTVQSEKNFFTRMFSMTKNSPSYLLQKELFEFLSKSTVLSEEFPFIKNDERFQENWMLVHSVLLKNRFRQQREFHETISQAEIEKFDYNLQTYFFCSHGQILNPHIPVRDFAQHYAEVYMKKLRLFEELDVQNEKQWNDKHGKGSNQKTRDDTNQRYGQFLQQTVYENRVKKEDLELVKLCKYYAAHKRYLSTLEWQDMLEYKVKWGFEGDIRLIQKF